MKFTNLCEYVEAGLGLHPYENDGAYDEAFKDAIVEYAIEYDGLTPADLVYILGADPDLYEELPNFLDSYMLFIYDSPNGEIIEHERLYSYEYALNAYDEAKDCYKRLISVEAGGVIDGEIDKRNF